VAQDPVMDAGRVDGGVEVMSGAEHFLAQDFQIDLHKMASSLGRIPVVGALARL
jgi:hypothetical protein